MSEESLSSFTFYTAISAFIGAFFSYLFVRAAEVLKAFYDRQVLGYNALVTMERQLLLIINDISNNTYSIDETLKLRKSNEVPITFTRLVPLAFDISNSHQLLNLSFINELAVFYTDTRKIDLDIESLNSMYSEMRELLFNKTFNNDTYKSNFAGYLDRLALTQKFLVDVEGKAKRLVAICQIMANKKPPISRLILWVSRPKTPSEAEINSRLKIINDQIRQGVKENSMEIEEILKK